MSRILGIDPGLNITGYGVLELLTPSGRKVKLLEGGVVRSKSKVLAEKVKEIYLGVSDVIRAFEPRELALEELYSHYDRPTTAILMGHARGAICLAAALNGLTVHSYSATRIKKVLTGNGRAAKDQMQRAVQLEFALPQYPDPPDVADALAVALCHTFLRNGI